ncbi:uncharacterized protein LOC118763774 [Octopus sinensis]|uniref:Uncharacterized protein LOC118763774 n=1 Tax=Octopus sinensis TaxID=2607531 RepID=A0A7E6EWR3_9MOLL|nr:uncharacterized protein LOC118763774 [Octopus sinensis]
MSKSVAVEDSCTSFMESKCPQAKKDYPIAKPDLDYCKRLEKYKSCAKNINEKCWDFYNGLSIDNCPRNDICINEFQNLCPNAERNYPKRIPDSNFCNRLLTYYMCAHEVAHECERHFVTVYHIICKTADKISECEGKYRYKALPNYE